MIMPEPAFTSADIPEGEYLAVFIGGPKDRRGILVPHNVDFGIDGFAPGYELVFKGQFLNGRWVHRYEWVGTT